MPFFPSGHFEVLLHFVCTVLCTKIKFGDATRSTFVPAEKTQRLLLRCLLKRREVVLELQWFCEQ